MTMPLATLLRQLILNSVGSQADKNRALEAIATTNVENISPTRSANKERIILIEEAVLRPAPQVVKLEDLANETAPAEFRVMSDADLEEESEWDAMRAPDRCAVPSQPPIEKEKVVPTTVDSFEKPVWLDSPTVDEFSEISEQLNIDVRRLRKLVASFGWSPGQYGSVQDFIEIALTRLAQLDEDAHTKIAADGLLVQLYSAATSFGYGRNMALSSWLTKELTELKTFREMDLDGFKKSIERLLKVLDGGV